MKEILTGAAVIVGAYVATAAAAAAVFTIGVAMIHSKPKPNNKRRAHK